MFRLRTYGQECGISALSFLICKLNLDKWWWAEGTFPDQKSEARVFILGLKENGGSKGGMSPGECGNVQKYRMD